MILFITIDLIIIYQRPNLLKNAILIAILIALIAFLCYQFIFIFANGQITTLWWFHNKNKILILGVPIEEILWGLSCGFLAGPLYEFTYGLKQVKFTK